MRLESRVAWEVLGIWKAKTRDEHVLVLKCKAGLEGLSCAKTSQDQIRGTGGMIAHIGTWEENLMLENLAHLHCQQMPTKPTGEHLIPASHCFPCSYMQQDPMTTSELVS